jgi:hypothetical protein
MEQLLSYDPTVEGTGPFDGQRDIFNFNFNGYIGQFILDTTRNTVGHYTWQPLLLTHSSLKIERIVGPAGLILKLRQVMVFSIFLVEAGGSILLAFRKVYPRVVEALLIQMYECLVS